MAAARRKTSELSRGDGRVQLHTLVNESIGGVGGEVTLETLLSLCALLSLDEMSMDDLYQILKTGDLFELVVLRRELELCSSSLVDKAVLEDIKTDSNAHSGSSILKNPSDPYYPLVKNLKSGVS